MTNDCWSLRTNIYNFSDLVRFARDFDNSAISVTIRKFFNQVCLRIFFFSKSSFYWFDLGNSEECFFFYFFDMYVRKLR